jgi:hypothetical protein
MSRLIWYLKMQKKDIAEQWLKFQNFLPMSVLSLNLFPYVDNNTKTYLAVTQTALPNIPINSSYDLALN